jgi:WhiB family transcriptional regulator, redox-sensing transcriptional regulator
LYPGGSLATIDVAHREDRSLAILKVCKPPETPGHAHSGAWFSGPGLVKAFTTMYTAVRIPIPTSRRVIMKEPDPMDWRNRAACLDEDPELFFPIGNTGPAILQIEEAKAVCRRCDVREQCLAWALEAGQDHGVWGGLSEDERRALKRRNARAKIRTA